MTSTAVRLKRAAGGSDHLGVVHLLGRTRWSVLTRALIGVGLVLAIGTVGFARIEGWSAWEAFYFTVVTITTVGYGDHGLSDQGRALAVVVMLLGIGTLTYTASELFRLAVAMGIDTERAMHKQIGLLREHAIVCGFGRIGHAVCEHLHEASCPFVLVDTDEHAVSEARELGYLAIVGDASEDRVLEECAVSRASSLVCVADSDAANIVITLSARDLNPSLQIFSRVEHEDAVRKIRRAGATHIVSPAMIGGRRIADAILRPRTVESLEMLGANTAGIRVTAAHLESGSPLIGQELGRVGAGHERIVFVGVEHADGRVHTRPEPGLVLREGDAIIVAGEPEPLVRFVESVTPGGARAA